MAARLDVTAAILAQPVAMLWQKETSLLPSRSSHDALLQADDSLALCIFFFTPI
jgi:hypothetical protein